MVHVVEILWSVIYALSLGAGCLSPLKIAEPELVKGGSITTDFYQNGIWENKNKLGEALGWHHGEFYHIGSLSCMHPDPPPPQCPSVYCPHQYLSSLNGTGWYTKVESTIVANTITNKPTNLVLTTDPSTSIISAPSSSSRSSAIATSSSAFIKKKSNSA